MLRKGLIQLSMVGWIVISPLSGYTLQDSVAETLNTNPLIQEKLRDFRARQQDLNIAESEYYPQIDLSASVGYNKAGRIKDDGDSDFDHTVNESTYKNYQSSLTFTQNLFNGFSTTSKVDFEKTRGLASAYKYLEQSNDVAFQMTKAYIDVLKTNELVNTARENVQINESIYSKVKDLFEAGLTTDSEVKKIQSTLSLAKSNLTVKKNNAMDAEYKYRRVLGRLPEVGDMQKPDLNVQMPQSIEKAALYAIQNNPSLLVSRYNIQGAQALLKQKQSGNYPKLDLEVSQSFNDNDELGNGFDQPDDRFKARLILTYNLFRGGADEAEAQKQISLVGKEVDIQRDLKRQVVEGLDLSWNSYSMIEKQLVDLREYSQYSEKTLELYKEEYDLGRRSLLDLLSAQSDVINSRSQIITAEYDYLFAKYRILDAMGLLVSAINGDTDELTSKVNINVENAEEVLDTMSVNLDVDEDKITDNVDLCDNSLKENNVMPYGCKLVILDSDNDGIPNHKDECANTPYGIEIGPNGCEIDSDGDGIGDSRDNCPKTLPGLEVGPNGCEVDSDSDGIVDSLDSCNQTPEGYGVDESGCANLVTISVNFKKNSTELPSDIAQKVDQLAKYMQERPELTAKIVGHSSRTSVSKALYNLNLSKARADRVKNELIDYGIDSNKLESIGKGFDEPIADNATQEGRIKNRRVEIELIK